MKKLLFCATLLATTAGLASAGPGGSINLGWSNCPAGAGYALSQTFACNTNAASPTHVMFGSFVAGESLIVVTGFTAVLDLQTSGATLAPWWQVRASLPAGCRPTSLGPSFDFTGGPFDCYDYWQGAIGGGASAEYPTTAANRARLKAQAALPLGDARITSIAEGTEVYCFKLSINNLKTVGLGSCAGCSDEACIVLNQIQLTQTPGTPVSPRIYTVPATASHIVWQAWTTTDPQHLCPGVTPVKNRTWGGIKAIYR